MEKFLSIPVTGEGNQLVSCNNIKLIEQATTTSVTIVYGGAAAQDVITINHGTASAEEMRDAIQNAVVSALSTPWQKPSYQVSNLPQAVSGIGIA